MSRGTAAAVRLGRGGAILRLIRWAAFGLVLVVAGVAASSWYARRPPAPLTIGAAVTFDLVDSNGRRVTQAAYPGKWLLVYFGYANCPDVCPADLQKISDALDQLGPKAEAIAPLFITIDPERDTEAALGQYVSLFDPRLVGLTGSPRQISLAEKSFHAFSRQIAETFTTNYLFAHSTYVYLISPRGELRMLSESGVGPADLARALDSTISRER